MNFLKKIMAAVFRSAHELLRIGVKALVAAVLASAPFFPFFDVFYLKFDSLFSYFLWAFFFGSFLYFFFVTFFLYN